MWTGDQVFLLKGNVQVGINLWQPVLTFMLVNVLMTASLVNTVRVSKRFSPYFLNYLLSIN